MNGADDPVQELIGRTVAAYFVDVTGRTEPESGDLDLAYDIHQALLSAAPGTISPVLELHRPVRRYQAGSRLDTLTYPTAERAYQANLNHSMRGFETLVMASPADVPFIEVCAECSRVENSFDQGDDAYGDDHDDHQDGSWLSVKASAWPCATYTALFGRDGQASPEAKALATIGSVVDRWYNGALINRGDYEGIVWVEPLSPLPPGADEIRDALELPPVPETKSLRNAIAEGE